MRSSCIMVLDGVKGMNPDEVSRLRKVVEQ